jgi:metal-sulfur cluster biosynthetic enzyme/ribosomal protein L22
VSAARPALTAELRTEEPQLRVSRDDARAALRAVAGQPAVRARARLRFGPGRTCEPVARLLDRAIVAAENAGLDPARLVVAGGTAQAAEDIVRVRRTAHGQADWIRSPTCRVQVILAPAGLHATAGRDAGAGPDAAAPLPEPPGRPESPPPAPAPAATAGSAAVRAALADVIDPDLGVNIVDLGFVRAVTVEARTAVITMTLTSAACPLTAVLESQIAAGLAPLGGIEGFRIDWQWIPAWSPADVSGSGRDQLRAIGFTI